MLWNQLPEFVKDEWLAGSGRIFRYTDDEFSISLSLSAEGDSVAEQKRVHNFTFTPKDLALVAFNAKNHSYATCARMMC